MDFITNPLILVTFFPLVGVLALLFIPSGKEECPPLDGAGRLAGDLRPLHLDADPVRQDQP